MKCSRLSCVILAVAAQCAAGFLVTGNHGVMAPSLRHRESTSRAAAEAQCQRGGIDTLMMGAAGKKRKKVRRPSSMTATLRKALTYQVRRVALVTTHKYHLCLTRWHMVSRRRCHVLVWCTRSC